MGRVAVVIGVLLLSAPAPAPAKDKQAARDDAAQRLARARAAYDRGDFGESAQLYLEARDIAQASQLGGAPAMTFNAGLGFQQAGDCVRAVQLFREFAQMDPAAAGAAPTYKDRLAAAQRCAPDIAVQSDPAGADVSLNGKVIGRAPLTVPLAPGRYQLALSKQGYTREQRDLVLRAGEPLRFDVTLKEEAPLVPPAPPPPIAQKETPPPAALEIAPQPEERASPWPFVSGGAALAFGVGAIAIHLVAWGEYRDASGLAASCSENMALEGCSKAHRLELENSYNRDQNIAAALYIGAGFFTAATLWLLLRSNGDAPDGLAVSSRSVTLHF